MLHGRLLKGRKQIFTNESRITSENVLDVLNAALQKHSANRSDIVYLEDYVRGIQPILERVKTVNPEITNNIVVNLANSIVTFKTAEFAGEPIQYVSRGAKKSIPKKIERLNAMLISEGKQSKDMDLAFKMFTCGVGYRLTIHNRNSELFDEAPFEIHIPEPKNTFVVRLNDVSKRVVMGVTYVFLDETDKVRYTVYTDDAAYTIEGSSFKANNITNITVHRFGIVPLVEYPCNSLYMSPIEVVHDLLNEYSLLESNRMDNVDQIIEALLVLRGVELTSEELREMKARGAIMLPPTGDGMERPDVSFISQILDQGQTQTLVDNLYQEILQIVGMPSQGNANTSDSSNNGAVILKNGWWSAESRALETEGMWTTAETEFLKIVLKICEDSGKLNGLSVSDMKLKFGRRSYEDKLTKTQSFSTLIAAGCPPIQAYTVSGIVTDPEAAAIAFENYQSERQAALDTLPELIASSQVGYEDEE